MLFIKVMSYSDNLNNSVTLQFYSYVGDGWVGGFSLFQIDVITVRDVSFPVSSSMKHLMHTYNELILSNRINWRNKFLLVCGDINNSQNTQD